MSKRKVIFVFLKKFYHKIFSSNSTQKIVTAIRYIRIGRNLLPVPVYSTTPLSTQLSRNVGLAPVLGNSSILFGRIVNATFALSTTVSVASQAGFLVSSLSGFYYACKYYRLNDLLSTSFIGFSAITDVTSFGFIHCKKSEFVYNNLFFVTLCCKKIVKVIRSTYGDYVLIKELCGFVGKFGGPLPPLPLP